MEQGTNWKSENTMVDYLVAQCQDPDEGVIDSSCEKCLSCNNKSA